MIRSVRPFDPHETLSSAPATILYSQCPRDFLDDSRPGLRIASDEDRRLPFDHSKILSLSRTGACGSNWTFVSPANTFAQIKPGGVTGEPLRAAYRRGKIESVCDDWTLSRGSAGA